LRSHEALTGLRVSADLQKQICLRKSAEPLWASLKDIAVQGRLATYCDRQKVETRKPLKKTGSILKIHKSRNKI
jgi:hypothetical protein